MKTDPSALSALTARSGPHPLPWGFSVLVPLAAIAFGLIASSGNPIAIGIGFGLIAVPFLVAKPGLVIDLALVSSLLAGTLISLAGPGFAALSWSISLLTFALLPQALIRLAHSRRTPRFVWAALAFLLGSMLVSAVQWDSAQEFVAGSKRYFQGYGVLFALAVLAFTPRQIARWKTMMLGIAFLQLPFAVYEFVVLVPLRGGLAAGGEATDVVAGTFGANLRGGSANAEMSAFLLIVMVFLIAHWRVGLLETKRLAWMGLLCLAPLALGETKIVVILLPLIGLVLLRKDLVRRPWRYLPGIILCALLTLLLAYVYISIMDRSNVDDALRAMAGYNVGSVGYGGNLLNRTSVITFWWSRHDLSFPVQFFFGHGLGSSFWGDNSPLPGHVAVRLPHYGIDLTTASTLLWDVGVIGLGLHALIFIMAWIDANRLWRASSDAAVRADALAIQAAIAIFVVFIGYRNSGVNLLAFEMVVALVLGYLAHLSSVSMRRVPVAAGGRPRSAGAS